MVIPGFSGSLPCGYSRSSIHLNSSNLFLFFYFINLYYLNIGWQYDRFFDTIYSDSVLSILGFGIAYLGGNIPAK